MALFANPTQPNLADYITFLGSIGIPSNMIPPDFTGTGTLVAASTALTIASVTTGALYAGAAVYDADASIQVGTTIQTPVPAGGGVGSYVMSLPAVTNEAVPEAITAYNGQVLTTFNVAMDTVNDALSSGSPTLYTLAVYNLGADRLINFAVDITNQTFFADLRSTYRITDISVGVPSSASDNGTSTGILNPEQMRLLTLADLQTLKTPWGRTYMGIAQNYGQTLWGLT